MTCVVIGLIESEWNWQLY